MSKTEELNIVTEVGVFGDLNIDDPTIKKVKKQEESLDAIIESATAENLKNLEAVCE